MKNVLFVCGKNRLRSPTAEHIFANYQGIECSSAGVNHDADNPLTPELVEWADLIFVMEKSQKNKLSQKFKPYLSRAKIICLDIPDKYEFMSPALIELLKLKVANHLP